jgi:2-oxoglutarate ferredoxin oxidoreductase subunit delta
LETVKDALDTFPLSIHKKLCKRCGICIFFCPVQVYTADLDGSPIITYPERCIRCKICFHRCPDFAIDWEAEE